MKSDSVRLGKVIFLFLILSLFCFREVSAKSNSPFCGPEVLGKVFEKFQRTVHLTKLEALARRQYGLTSFEDLSHEARKQKLFTLAFEDGDLATLKQALNHGFVIINNRGHFALIEKVEGKNIFVYNPGFAAGHYSLSWDIFQHHWDHMGLIVSNKKIRIPKSAQKILTQKERRGILGANPCGNTSGLGGPSAGYSIANGPSVGTSGSSANKTQPSTKDPVHIQNGNLHIDDQDIALPAKGLLLELTRYYNSQIVSEVPGLVPEEGAGSWAIENGEYSGEGDRNGTTKTWKDATIEADMQTIKAGTQSWEVGWLNFRYIDANNRYYVLLHTTGLLELAKRQNATDASPPIVLAQKPIGLSPLAKNRFKVVAVGNNFKVYVNGAIQINYTDGNPINQSGRVTLEAYFSHAHFDNLSVIGENNNYAANFDTDDNDFIFGYGWTHAYGLKVIDYGDHVTLFRENNAKERYNYNAGVYTPVPYQTYSTLTKDVSGYSLRSKHGLIHRFDLSGKLLYVEDHNGNRTTLTYALIGGKNRPTEITSSGGRKITLQYGANNLVSSAIDPANFIVYYTYDVNGFLTQVKDRRGKITYYTYDPVTRNMIELKNTDGKIFKYAYLYNDRVASQTDPNGVLTRFDYNWDTVHVINQNNEITKYNFNARLFLQAVEDPNGFAALSQKNDQGKPLNYTDKNGRTTQFQHDANGNLTSIQDPLLNFTYITYDSVFNQPTSFKDPRGNLTSYQYDTKGNLLKSIDPFLKEINFTYDTIGQLTSVKDQRNNITTFTYNANGDLIETLAPGNRKTTFTYDTRGLLKTITDPLNHTTTYTYDANGNLTSVTDPLLRKTTYTYSNMNDLLTIKDPLLRVTKFTYDAFGNPLTMTDPALKITKFNYATNNEMHLGVANLLSLTDPKNIIQANISYDAVNRPLSETDPAGKKIDFTYDQQGNLVKRVDAKSQTTDYVFDQLNRIYVMDYPPGGGTDVVHGYDPAGNVTTLTDALGNTSCTYDALNRVSKITYPGNLVVNYTYDAAGNVTQVKYPSGVTADYVYNNNNELTQVKRNGAIQVQYQYDLAGRRTVKEFFTTPRVQIQYGYDIADQLTSLKVVRMDTGTVLKELAYQYDNAGNRTQVTDPVGVHNYTYDNLYQITGETGAQTHSYNYDASGNRISADGISYTVNNLNQYTNVGGQNYAYDFNGNLTYDGVNTYAYDFENRPILITGPKSIGYAYDSFGRRLSKNVNGTFTKFIYNGWQTIEERNATNSLIASYIYSDELDEVISMTRAGKTYFYLHDGLGSVIGLLNTAGMIVESYSYDPYGLPLQTSTVGNPYLFTGQRYDSETGLYYYKARYYNPKIGRFLQRDLIGFEDGVNLYAYADSVGKPTLYHPNNFTNLYNFVGNNPINRVDPLGLWYIDINISYGWSTGKVGTFGFQFSNKGIYFYGGGGVGTFGPGFALTGSPYDPTKGWNVGAQGGYYGGAQYGVDSNNVQFWEAGFVTPGVSTTAYYIQPLWEWGKNQSPCEKKEK